MLGGLFNVVVAPLVFLGHGEYPLMIALVCVLRPARAGKSFDLRDVGVALLVGCLTALLILVGRDADLPAGPISVAAMFALPLLVVYFLQNRPLRFGLSFGFLFLASALYAGVHGPAILRVRSFFGTHRVTEEDGFRKLFHGNILHGEQSTDAERRHIPLTYYYPTGPIGQLLGSLSDDNRLKRVGLIGLGTGALAAYAQPGQHWTFFEIDPAVASIAAPATGMFSYLKDSKGQVDVIIGDGRLRVRQSKDIFGVLVIDAFGSDAIPLHLLTREALAEYRTHLNQDGIVAFHISNRYVDLEPVLANLAHEAGLTCRIQADLNTSAEDAAKGKSPSIWLVIARSDADLGALAKNTRWPPARGRPEMGVWTDDFSNLVSVLRWTD